MRRDEVNIAYGNKFLPFSEGVVSSTNFLFDGTGYTFEC